MIVDFDKFNRFELPVLTLVNPNRQELGQLGSYLDLQLDLNFNAVSELKFEYPEKRENGELSNLYHEIKNKRLIRTEYLGYYLITDCEENYDGITRKLSVTATSAEIELNYRKINLFDGTYKFYDALNPSETLLGKLLETIPNWSIGYVSPELQVKYRTFDVPDSTLYSFLMSDVESAYECIFEFDTYNRLINAYSPSDIVRPTDIYVSYQNLIKSLSLKEDNSEIYTAMSCYGGGNLSIATVNPLGSATIYNFNYFKDQMSDSLRNAIVKWELLCKENTELYKTALLNLKQQNTELIRLNSELTDLRGEYDAQKEVQAAMIQQGITTDPQYTVVTNEMERLSGLINETNLIISEQKDIIASTSMQLKEINELLSFKNRDVFSIDDELELENYKYETTYQDDAFIQTSQMSLVEIQDMAQSLYDQSVSALNRASHPRYEITIDSINFMLLPEFAPIINSIDNNADERMKQVLGSSFFLEVDNEEYIEPILLSVHLNFSDPTDFSLTFANRYRLDNSYWMFDDLYGESAKTSSTINFDISGLKDWESYQNDLVSFANSSLDLSRNALINDSVNIDMVFDSTGLIGKKFNPDSGDYLGEQVWLTYNTLAFSKDKFKTVETAVGKIQMPDGTYGYGINGGVIIGKILFGSSMTIANKDNSIVMDENGFKMETSSGVSRIIMSPSDGIKIQGKNGAEWEDQLYADANGNLILKSTITATDGYIGGWQIKTDGLYSTWGDYIKSDGTGKLGLMSWTPSSATFNGRIYASNLVDKIQSYNIAPYAVGTSNIASGAVTPSELDREYATQAAFSQLSAQVANFGNIYVKNNGYFGGTVYWSNGEIRNSGLGIVIDSDGEVDYIAKNGHLFMGSNVRIYRSLLVDGSIVVAGSQGVSGSFTAGSKSITVTNGIITKIS